MKTGQKKTTYQNGIRVVEDVVFTGKPAGIKTIKGAISAMGSLYQEQKAVIHSFLWKIYKVIV
jgi:hypothetical protein